MRTGAVLLHFDLSGLLATLARTPDARIGAVTITLPFVGVRLEITDRERFLAEELLVRLRDRRVLQSRECWDGCINDAVRSLQEIRSDLVRTQMALITDEGEALGHLVELMLIGLRQFLTFEQSIGSAVNRTPVRNELYRSPEHRQTYFDALEQLRAHLSRSLGQVALVAGLPFPSDGIFPDYQGDWDLDAYVQCERSLSVDRSSKPSVDLTSMPCPMTIALAGTG